MSRPCPHPDKAAYPIKKDALEAWRGLRQGDRQRNRRGKRRKSKDVTMYRCETGDHWHLGRRPRKMRNL